LWAEEGNETGGKRGKREREIDKEKERLRRSLETCPINSTLLNSIYMNNLKYPLSGLLNKIQDKICPTAKQIFLKLF